MIKTFIILFIIVFFIWFKTSKIHVDWKSLILPGFSKFDNDFGLFCYCGKQGKRKNVFGCSISNKTKEEKKL